MLATPSHAASVTKHDSQYEARNPENGAGEPRSKKLLVAPGLTSNKKLVVTKGIASLLGARTLLGSCGILWIRIGRFGLMV